MYKCSSIHVHWMITAGKQFDPQTHTIALLHRRRIWNLFTDISNASYWFPVLSYSLSLYVYLSYLSIRTTILVVAPMDSIFLRFSLWEIMPYPISSLFYDILWYLMALFILLQVATPHTLRFYTNISWWHTNIDFFIQTFKWMF